MRLSPTGSFILDCNKVKKEVNRTTYNIPSAVVCDAVLARILLKDLVKLNNVAVHFHHAAS